MRGARTTLVLMGLTLAAAGGAHGEGRFSEQDIAMLPTYCQDKVLQRNADAWRTVFDWNDWRHGHHYCYGMIFLNRARLGRDRAASVANAISNFEYVDRSWSTEFSLRPQMHVQLGKALELRGGKDDDAAAYLNYQQAVKLQPDYAPAYAALSDYHKDRNDFATARAVLEEGLKNAPDSGILKRRLSRLNN